MDIPTAITLAIAVLGAVLGIINTWQAITRDRIRLRVIPKIYFEYGDTVLIGEIIPAPESRLSRLIRDSMGRKIDFCFEIVNVGLIPVVVSEVGFLMRNTKERCFITRPRISDGGSWPRRLEARQAITILVPHSDEARLIYSDLKCAYAATACGLTFKGTSRIFREVVRRARRNKPNKALEATSKPAPGADSSTPQG